MLTSRRVHSTLPVSDMERARAFYERTLGFEPEAILPGGVRYRAGEGTTFVIFPSSGRASGSHTQMGFTVDDIEAEVAALKSRGVAFETYDFAGFDAASSIATLPANRAAWFRDSEGNLLGIVQFVTP